MPAPSIRSIGSKSLRALKAPFKKFGSRDSRSPFTTTTKVEVPDPAPVKSEPSTRPIKTEDAKKETKGTDAKKEKDRNDAASADQDDVDANKTVVHGSSKDAEKNMTKQTDKEFVKDSFKKKTEEKTTTKGPFALAAHHETGSLPHTVEHTEYSHYTPNANAIFTTHYAAEQALSGNIDIEWKQLKFLTVPVRLYLATMYYVRILMIREALRRNDPATSTWLRKFLREYDPASLPLPGYLLPHFQAISAYAHSDDGRITWTYPEIPNDIGTRMNSNNANDRSFKLTQPNPAQLFDFMRFYCSSTAAHNMDDEDAFSTAGHFHILALGAGVRFGSRVYTAAPTEDEALCLANPSLNEPFPESHSTFLERRRVWQSSKFRRFANDRGRDDAVNTIPEFLHLVGDMDWFNECISMTRIMCGFFAYSTNFGQLDFEAGPETVIFSDVTFNRRRGAAAPWNNANLPNLTERPWYPRMSDTAHANTTVFEKDVSHMCYLIAKHTLMNSRLTFRYVFDADINAAAHELVALPRADLNGYRARAGPFFNSDRAGTANDDGAVVTVWQRSYDLRTPVLTGMEDYVRDGYYLKDGA